MTKFPKYRFVIMGFLDLCHSMSLLVAGGNTPAPLTVILMQNIIPMTVLISRAYFRIRFVFYLLRGYYFLKSRFKLKTNAAELRIFRYADVQYLGAGLVFSGSMIAVGPIFLGVFSSDFQRQQVGWNSLVYFLASIPGALSMLYKERVIRKYPMDIWYLNAWVSSYQFMFGVLLSPMIFNWDLLHLNQKFDGFAACLFHGVSSTSVDFCQVRVSIWPNFGAWI